MKSKTCLDNIPQVYKEINLEEIISSIVRDKVPSKAWETVKHYIFEVPYAKGTLQKRLEKVKPFLSSTLKLLKQIPVKDKRHLAEYLKEIEDKKGEGWLYETQKHLTLTKELLRHSGKNISRC